MSSYTDRVAHYLEGLTAVSVGACPGCCECGLDRDSFRLAGASIRGNPLRLWDEGSGDVFVYFETLGPVGVVRADSWEEAWECVVDEVMDDADPADPDSYARSYDETADEGELAEGVHYRSNGVPSNPALQSALAREDLNGAGLIPLGLKSDETPEDSAEVHGWIIDLEWDPSAEDASEYAEDGGFSWSDCEICGSTLGGDRFPWHAIGSDGRILHGTCCADCTVYLANGEEPEGSEEENEDSDGT